MSHTKEDMMLDRSMEAQDSARERRRRIKLHIARSIPFLSLFGNIVFLHLLSDIQSDLQLTSSVTVGRILAHRPHFATDSSDGNGSQHADGSENEWQAYLGALAIVRMGLWASAAGNVLGCYGVLKPASRFILFSVLQAHVELLLGLSATVPVLIMILLPDLFLNVEPITPVICSEILSHPQAVRDLFEPLRMFTPYDEFAGCDTWVSGVAAPVALFAAIAWGCVKWKTNTFLHALYRSIRLVESDGDIEGLRPSRGGAITLSSSDDEAEAAGSKRGIDPEKQSPQNYHREEAAKGHRRVRSLKVDLVIPSRREIQTAKQSQEPMLFAPVPRTEMPPTLSTIQVELPQ
jgi:hypothetical protein